MKLHSSSNRAAIMLCFMTLVFIAGRSLVDARKKQNRARFLSTSRVALGLRERRRGPSQGVAARGNGRSAVRAGD